jgi:hypothetical protein
MIGTRACAFFAAAFAALAAPAAKAAAPAAIPDFSGLWTHPYWPSFDPPLSGPGPVVNRQRLPSGTGNGNKLVGDYTNPILKPKAAVVVKTLGEISLSDHTYPTPGNQCWPQPVPYILWTIDIQMLQRPNEVTILYSNPNHEVRHVYLNRPHLRHAAPSWYGDSVGHYEGDTLVVDTIGVRADRPLAMADVYGTPYTKSVHVVERYRLISYEEGQQGIARALTQNIRIPMDDSGLIVDEAYKGKALQLQFTVEDSDVFTRPWSASMTYRRASGSWAEAVCAENTHEYYSGSETAVPQAEAPDF